ncbi:MAG: aspartate aminotransferase family protein [Moraxellaceae bacterium]|jgi:acetylornithine/N-succinyldiaminopimelate aminotransferase|nr:aspartate aminotransferase family protein [Moraxellaceae bacterium]MBP8851744.1 aspartate aminotransferase family protein [Moraxellaceae bacterium]MBP9045638.1 aspartate aminotransferase family protein [Moraxellaceae bacterium]MBP9730740.1 aspartate aminotransferase family protein [Moraxellaceae bacterium]MCC6201225.1 aspartate aminotransferase family protein [Moraxellaceae bacterium]
MTSMLMPTYARQPVAFSRGEGVWLYDTEGRRYLDTTAGIAVCGLGHANPVVAEAIADQARTLVHTSNLFQVPLQEALGAELTKVSGMDLAFFGNSGAEANEAAIKLARMYGHKHKHVDLPTIIVMENSFHGRTLATLTATGNTKVQDGFGPLVQGFVRVPYDDIAAIEKVAAENPNIVAILVEPIQGESGVRMAKNGFGYLEQLRAVCDKHDWLLMLDEIQTGNGRTGKYFAYQHTNIMPDVVTTAKGLGNGFPIGACLVHGKADNLFGPGNHGSTYGGTPLGCRAALTTVQELQKGPIDNARVMGERITAGFLKNLGDLGVYVEGAGLMLGVVLPKPCGELVARGRDAGVLLIVSAENRIRLLPPLIISAEEADLLVEKISALVRTFLTEGAAA